jgi:hypothetical protein
MEARLSDLQERLNKAESAGGGGGRVALGAKGLPLPLPKAEDGPDAQLRESLRAALDKLKKTGRLRCAWLCLSLPGCLRLPCFPRLSRAEKSLWP